jgi:hypothetical protein
LGLILDRIEGAILATVSGCRGDDQLAYGAATYCYCNAASRRQESWAAMGRPAFIQERTYCGVPQVS